MVESVYNKFFEDKRCDKRFYDVLPIILAKNFADRKQLKGLFHGSLFASLQENLEGIVPLIGVRCALQRIVACFIFR